MRREGLGPINMNKKRILAGVLVLAMMMTVFSACSKKESAKEIMEKSIEKSMDIKSSKQKFDMDISFDPGMTEEEMAQDPMSGGVIEMLNSMKVNGEFVSDTDAGISGGNILVDMKGMQFNLEVYANNMGSVSIKVPMSEKYITVNGSGEVPVEEDIEEMKTFSKEIAADFMDGFTDENMVLEDKNVELIDGTHDLKEITITLNDAEAKELIKGLLPKVYSNETMRKSLEPNLRMQWEMEGKDPGDMDIEAELDKMVEEALQAYDEAVETYTIDEFVVAFGIDEDYNTRQTNMKIAYSVADETTEKTISMGFDFTSEMYDINEPVSIDMPEINEENSITMEEFIMGMMFGGMPQM
jgi:hypothetical protein